MRGDRSRKPSGLSSGKGGTGEPCGAAVLFKESDQKAGECGLTKEAGLAIIKIYARTQDVCIPVPTRGCTGFDGGFEVLAAIRGPQPRHKAETKYKRRQ